VCLTAAIVLFSVPSFSQNVPEAGQLLTPAATAAVAEALSPAWLTRLLAH